MSKSLINVINSASIYYADNTAFTDTIAAYTYLETRQIGDCIASGIIKLGLFKAPIALYLPRSAKVPLAMAGTLLSGNFYTALDTDSPADRLEKIALSLEAKLVICLEEALSATRSTFPNINVVSLESLMATSVNDTALAVIENSVNDSDIAFTIFTSGSTGTPKGTMITHKNVIAYTTWFIKRFDIDSSVNFGSQTPFFFSMSVSDLFGAWITGASYNIIPKSYFAFPARLMTYLNEKKINTIYWVPTALDIVAKFDLLSFELPKYLKRIFFAGESMPVKVLNYWRKHLPNVMYANLFGPTETTDICAYYVVNRDFQDDESLPIGIACEGARLIVLTENGKATTDVGESGELYVAGDFVTLGYINEPTKTAQAFVQNPLRPSPREIVYKTGDLVAYNELGELMYLGRSDTQIKYKGYRIELGEIETIMNAVDGIRRCVCLYDAKNEEIIMLYEGDSAIMNDVASAAKARLAQYMTPHKIIALDYFPVNANGKIDRALLKKTYIN